MGSLAFGDILNEPNSGAFLVFPALSGNPTQTLDFILTNGFAFTPPAGYLGSGGSACALASATAGDSCTVFSGSPFLLTYNADNSTTVSLFAAGTVADPNNSTPASWSGEFTTQFSASSPTTIYNEICPGGNCTGSAQSTYSGSFSVTATPEPGTVAMVLIGGFLLASSLRKRKAKG